LMENAFAQPVGSMLGLIAQTTEIYAHCRQLVLSLF
jgi:hypothetical protein